MYSWYDVKIHIYIHTYIHTPLAFNMLMWGSLRLAPSTTVGSDTETSLYVHVVGFSTGWVRD